MDIMVRWKKKLKLITILILKTLGDASIVSALNHVTRWLETLRLKIVS